MQRFTVLCIALFVGLLITAQAHTQDTVGFGVPVSGDSATISRLEGPFPTAEEASDYGRDMVFRNEAVRFWVFRSCGGFYCRIWYSGIRDEGRCDGAPPPPTAGRGLP